VGFDSNGYLLENRICGFFSTFLTYLLNLLSMKELKPTTVAVYLFTTAFATIFAISLGKTIEFGENWFCSLIFGGVYLVTIKRMKLE
jgi:drug/metabolite transporter (DMT)-like permease